MNIWCSSRSFPTVLLKHSGYALKERTAKGGLEEEIIFPPGKSGIGNVATGARLDANAMALRPMACVGTMIVTHVVGSAQPPSTPPRAFIIDQDGKCVECAKTVDEDLVVCRECEDVIVGEAEGEGMVHPECVVARGVGKQAYLSHCAK